MFHFEALKYIYQMLFQASIFRVYCPKTINLQVNNIKLYFNLKVLKFLLSLTFLHKPIHILSKTKHLLHRLRSCKSEAFKLVLSHSRCRYQESFCPRVTCISLENTYIKIYLK